MVALVPNHSEMNCRLSPCLLGQAGVRSLSKGESPHTPHSIDTRFPQESPKSSPQFIAEWWDSSRRDLNVEISETSLPYLYHSYPFMIWNPIFRGGA